MADAPRPERLIALARSVAARLLDLRDDQADVSVIAASMRSGAEFRGTNLWLLIFATFIASIGLNMNSAPVIIGAMLVSPLMGPIMAVGYGAAVNDFGLIRSAARHLAMAVTFSLLTSTLYFLVTPLSEARSEILARTSPTIWDVLIAVFGGLAGVVGVTRRERSNVLPGVAIATALMPPLCTSGYGIATLQPLYALGALYLFSINSVFIATATLVMTRLMRLPAIEPSDERAHARTRRVIGAIVLVTGVPSVWLAVDLVQQEVFLGRAEQFVAASFPRDQGTYVVMSESDPTARSIRVTVVGEPVDDDRRLALNQSLSLYGLTETTLEIAQTAREEVDVASLREQVAGDLHRDTIVALDAKTREIAALQRRIDQEKAAATALADVVEELRAMVPQATEVAVGRGTEWDGERLDDALLVTVTVPEPIGDAERTRIERWLRIRVDTDRVHLAIATSAPLLPP